MPVISIKDRVINMRAMDTCETFAAVGPPCPPDYETKLVPPGETPGGEL